MVNVNDEITTTHPGRVPDMNRNHRNQRSIGNFRRPRASVARYAPVTLLGTSALVPMPPRPEGTRLFHGLHRLT